MGKFMNNLNFIGLFSFFLLFLFGILFTIPIENCTEPNTRFYIEKPGTYYVSYNQPNCTIHIRNESVIIEGGGYSIHAISVEPQSPDSLLTGITIRNLKLNIIEAYPFTNNLRLEHSTVARVSISGNNSYFFNNTISNYNNITPFFLVGGSHTTIISNFIQTPVNCGGGWGGFCYVENNTLYGLFLSHGDATVINNYVFENGIGVTGSNNLIRDNQIINLGLAWWGIGIGFASNSVISNNKIINDIGMFSDGAGISITNSNSLTLDGNIIINTNMPPIYIDSSNSINLTNTVVSCNPNSLYHCYDFESRNSTFLVRDITFNGSQFPTTASFFVTVPTYLNINSSDAVLSPGMLNVSKYIDIQANHSLSINISYSESLGPNESLLRLYRYLGDYYLHNGSIIYRWNIVPESGVDVGNKIVFANITSFSLFAPLADVTPPEVNIISPQSNSVLYYSDIEISGTSIDSSLNYTNISIWQGSTLIDSKITDDIEWYVYFFGLNDGVYNITATAYDQIGNSATARVENITISTFGGGGGPSCGNGVCDPGENYISCPDDCPFSMFCGNGVCESWENCSTCSIDCGSCPPSPYCGDGVCSAGETCSSCPQDCGSCPPSDRPSCPSGMTRCAGTCVDTSSDPSNCGSCGIRCQDAQICSNGICVCPSGLELCNGECVNPLYDPDNCGSCGNKCILGVCINGQCQLNCPEGHYFSNGQCIPFTICSVGQIQCGSTCCLQTQSCDQNTLTCYPPICQVGKTQCGYDCVDLSSDINNCGSCGNSCPAGKICKDGICQSISLLDICPDFAPDKCGSTCTNFNIDKNNCGACGNRCHSSEVCIEGKCVLVPTCPIGSLACGNNCCSLSQSCDQITLSCTPQICQTGQTQCGSLCVDTSKDRLNCGVCGNRCEIDELCINGQCVSSSCGNGKCDSTENCSTCPQDCGSCECTSENPNLCNGICTNILTDSNNCGECGQICPVGYACENGVCKGMINSECDSDSDCSQGNCIDNKCQFITCRSDSDCLSTQYCNTNLNLCLDGCNSDSICQSIVGSSYFCQTSTHQCVSCPENTVYQAGLCVNESGGHLPLVYQPSPDNPSSLTSKPTFSYKKSPKFFFEQEKQAALDELFTIFGTSKTRLLAYDQCLRGSLCSSSNDCCGAPCLDSRCACSNSVCTTTADCCSGYCENGKCISPKSTSFFFLDSISSAFSRSGCSGLIEECSPDERTCISYCNGLNILLIASAAGLGAYLWSLFANPVIGLVAAFLPIVIGISTYPFVGIISAIFIFTFVYSRYLEKIQL